VRRPSHVPSHKPLGTVPLSHPLGSGTVGRTFLNNLRSCRRGPRQASRCSHPLWRGRVEWTAFVAALHARETLGRPPPGRPAGRCCSYMAWTPILRMPGSGAWAVPSWRAAILCTSTPRRSASWPRRPCSSIVPRPAACARGRFAEPERLEAGRPAGGYAVAPASLEPGAILLRMPGARRIFRYNLARRSARRSGPEACELGE
jgi:hypothetical protein